MRANTILAAVLLTWSASAMQGAAQAPFDGPPGAIRDVDSLTLSGLLEAANHGNAKAKYALGLRYESGSGGVRADSERALQWFEEAAMAGLAPAMTKAGSHYAREEGATDVAEATVWYRKAHASKDARGTLALAKLSCVGQGMPKDVPGCALLLDDAIVDLTPSDTRDGLQYALSEELMAMGSRYETGDGVTRDRLQAAAWYGRASVLGDADGVLAQAALARKNGETAKALVLLEALGANSGAFGPEKEPISYDQMLRLKDALREIAALYEKAGGNGAARAIPAEISLAKLDEPGGAIGLAKRYAQGEDVPRSAANAERLIAGAGDPAEIKSVDDVSGYWAVEGMIAEDYFTGEGAARNLQKALKLYTSAADAGDTSSAISLGLLLAEGKSIPFDAKKAAEYLLGIGTRWRPGYPRVPSIEYGPSQQQIAGLDSTDKQHFGLAARILGERYQQGNGVRKDLFKARQWYSRGASAGDGVAKARLEKMPMASPKIEITGGISGGVVGSVASASMGSTMRVGSAAPARSQSEEPTVEERYPNIETPDTVHPSEEFAVQVSLTGEQIDAQTRILSGNQRGGKLQIPIPAGMTSIELEVNLSAPGMEFVGGSNIGQIELTAGRDSTVAQFHLRAREASLNGKPARLMATFWYNHGFLARVERDIEVVADTAEKTAQETAALTPMVVKARPMLRAATAPQAEAKPGIVLDAEMATPDLTIVESQSEDTLHLTFVTRYASPVEAVLPKAAETRAYIRTKFAELARQGRGLTVETKESTAQLGEDASRAFGDDLYDRFAPLEFKQLYWQLRDAGVRLRTVQVLSDDPLLPWELMRPARTGGKDRQDFMGLTSRVARWQMGSSGLPRPPQTLDMQRLVVIAPKYSGAMALSGAQQEADALRKYKGFEHVKGDYSNVRALALDLPDGIVHFAGHGAVRDEKGGEQFEILLEDSEMAPATWKTLAAASHKHPFYFFNACEVGQATQTVGALDGWAPALLDSGASGYLGALWPVSDTVAGSFAVNFYKALSENTDTPLAEVVRQARQRTYDETHNPTALSYVLYADPFFAVKH